MAKQASSSQSASTGDLYLPFQKALPYFPSYGSQAVFDFDHKITDEIKNNIVELIENLDGEVGRLFRFPLL